MLRKSTQSGIRIDGKEDRERIRTLKKIVSDCINKLAINLIRNGLFLFAACSRHKDPIRTPWCCS